MHQNKEDNGDNLKFSLDIISTMFKSVLATKELGAEFHCSNQAYHYLASYIDNEDYQFFNFSRKFEQNLAPKITTLTFTNVDFSFRDFSTRENNRKHK